MTGTSGTESPFAAGQQIDAVRPWPDSVKDPAMNGAVEKLAAHFRRAFDAVPDARFCAGEIEGVTIVIAVGTAATRLQRFVTKDLNGVIQRKPNPVTYDGEFQLRWLAAGSRVMSAGDGSGAAIVVDAEGNERRIEVGDVLEVPL